MVIIRNCGFKTRTCNGSSRIRQGGGLLAILYWIHYFSEPKAALVAGLTDCTLLDKYNDITGPFVDSWDACWSLRFDVDLGDGDIEERHYVMTDASSENLLPPAWVTGGGTALQMQSVYIASHPSYYSWTELSTTFLAIWPPFLVEFFLTACGVEVVPGETVAYQDADELLGVAAAPLTVLTPNNVINIGANCYGFNFDVDAGIDTTPQMFRTSPNSAVSVIGSGSGEMQRIADALEDIAAQDFEIGLNNGSSIFRVKGKSTITGPGGGGEGP